MELLHTVVIPILVIALLAVGIWAVIELVLVLRRARKTVDTANELVTEAKTSLEPTLARIDPIVEQVQPAAARLDPLVERAQLTVDAANLEIMRLDQILEDVSKVTEVAGKAAQSVDTVTSAPAELVTGAVEKLRGAAKGSSRRNAAKRALSGEGADALPGAVEKGAGRQRAGVHADKTPIAAGSVPEEQPAAERPAPAGSTAPDPAAPAAQTPSATADGTAADAQEQ